MCTLPESMILFSIVVISIAVLCMTVVMVVLAAGEIRDIIKGR